MKATRISLTCRWILVLVAFASAVPLACQDSPAPLALVPMPREVKRSGDLPLRHAVAIRASANPEDKFAAQELADTLATAGIGGSDRAGARPAIMLLRLDTALAKDVLERNHLAFIDAMHDEGYVLVSEGDTLYDIAATGSGIFYGVQTIKQLIENRDGGVSIARVTVRDWPAMKYRGQDDDLSNGPFPTLDYQKKQIRTFAAYKLNIYSPYFENSLQYASEPLAAPPGGAMTRDEVKELVEYARHYHVTLIPQQEAFGHLHHLLLYDLYADLAEVPHGTVLAPGQPGSLQLVEKWSSEAAEIFPGPFLHIGADETDDLGQGRTKKDVADRGLGRVYVDFIQRIHAGLAPLDKRLLFWGDVAMNSPETVPRLPKDMIAVAWHYSMPDDGSGHFDSWITPFTNAGMETWVSPSANRGNRIDADDDNNLRTIQTFVADGQRLGATGMFNTVSDDGGEGLFDQNWYSVLFGAAASWQSGKTELAPFEQSYGQVFHHDHSGEVNQAMLELMEAHRALARAGFSATNKLFWEDPWSDQGRRDSEKLVPAAHEIRLHAENSMIHFERAKAVKGIQNSAVLEAMELGARKLDFIAEKFELAEEIADRYRALHDAQGDRARHNSIVDASYDVTGNNGRCQDLRDGYGLILDLFRAAWLRENRPYRLDNVTAQYMLSMQLWIGRSNNIRAAFDNFDKTGQLAPPESLGIPESPKR